MSWDFNQEKWILALLSDYGSQPLDGQCCPEKSHHVHLQNCPAVGRMLLLGSMAANVVPMRRERLRNLSTIKLATPTHNEHQITRGDTAVPTGIQSGLYELYWVKSFLSVLQAHFEDLATHSERALGLERERFLAFLGNDNPLLDCAERSTPAKWRRGEADRIDPAGLPGSRRDL
jgi:hypothetical protein